MDFLGGRERNLNERRQVDYFKTDKEVIKQVNSGLFTREAPK